MKPMSDDDWSNPAISVSSWVFTFTITPGFKFLYSLTNLTVSEFKSGVEKTVNETITELSRRLGNRIQNGKVCLDVTEELARDNIENADYSAIVFVKNKNHDDEASGTMQYFNWCSDNQDDPNEAQIWINDLCRISTEKQQVSPLEVLIKLFESIFINIFLVKIFTV